jgi:hypothetical protein
VLRRNYYFFYNLQPIIYNLHVLSARTKIVISGFVIVLALSIVLVLKFSRNEMISNNQTNVNQANNVSSELKLVSASNNVKVGEQFMISLSFKNLDTDVASFDAVVSYDPTAVRIDEIKPTNIFPVIARKLVEDFKSRFIVTGVQKEAGQKLSVSEGELAEIMITPLKPGKTSFSFIVDGRKYTNMASTASQDIPLKTNTLEVTVEQ